MTTLCIADTENTDKTVTHHGIIIEECDEFGRVKILECSPENDHLQVTMNWVHLTDPNCASSLMLVDGVSVHNREHDLHQDLVLQRALHAFDNEYSYNAAEDFPKYCQTGKDCHIIILVEDKDACDIGASGQVDSDTGFLSLKSEFNIGDHICWDYSVDNVKNDGVIMDIQDNDLTVMFWRKIRGQAMIVQEDFNMRDLKNIYLVDHHLKENSPLENVINRARSCLGKSDFNSGKDFALFCVTGIKPNKSSNTRSQEQPSGATALVPAFLGQTMALPDRTEINPGNYRHNLRPGDHITWHRTCIIWHHGIVVKVYSNEYSLDVIHWHKEDNKAPTVLEDKVKLDREDGQPYRVNYEDEIVDANPPDLVLARALSRVGETGYNLIFNNCEALATYCKTGVNISNQTCWLMRKATEVFKNSVIGSVRSWMKTIWKSPVKGMFVKAARTGVLGRSVEPAEAIETLIKGSNWVGIGFVILFEGGYCIYDLSTHYNNRKAGKMTYVTFLEETVNRVVEAILTSVLVSAGGLAGTAVAGYIGTSVLGTTILGGVAGGAGAKALGQLASPTIKTVTKSMVKVNNVAVNDMDDLCAGDQIFMYHWWLLPHYAIAIDGNPWKKKLKVIHSTNRQGVVEEWIDFTPPVYKLDYPMGVCRDPIEVIEMARSYKGGTNSHNAFTNNSKHFTDRCKIKESQ